MIEEKGYALALCLSGGNALASWQAGAWEALAARGYAPDRVVGASAGAVNGAIIAGSSPDRAVERLRRFWSPAGVDAAGWWPAEVDAWRRSFAATATLAGGRADVFGWRPFAGQPWARDGGPSPSLYDTHPLTATLAELVDWDRVADGPTRLSIAAVDLETGADVVFDGERERLGPDHVRASTALIPAFPPVRIGGRWLVAPGLSANLPLDAVLAEPGDRPLLIVALDLLPLAAPRPETLGETAGRLQDMVFATQTRRAVDAWRAVYALHGEDAPAVTLARLCYADQSREVAGKAFDFSPETAAERWIDGRRTADAFLDRLEAGAIEIGRPGLTVYQGAERAALDEATFRIRRAGKAG